MSSVSRPEKKEATVLAATSSIATRTIMAPVERVKLILQLQNELIKQVCPFTKSGVRTLKPRKDTALVSCNKRDNALSKKSPIEIPKFCRAIWRNVTFSID